jgi:DNA-binding transcriptional ArsR family regulator
MDPKAAADLANALRPQATPDWTFVMLSPTQNDAVVRWIMSSSKRPTTSVQLWARLFVLLDSRTGEVRASRAELADHLGIEPRTVSELLTELASINAIRREKEGRKVRIFMNSTVATHLPGAELRKAAREADGPLLRIMDGGRS